MFCYKCGFRFSDNNILFCPNCGSMRDGEKAVKTVSVYQMRKLNELIPQRIHRIVNFRIKIEFMFVKHRLGLCHCIWRRKKQIYAQYGYTWYTPAECNPDVIFD